jgi:hypothetical protein
LRELGADVRLLKDYLPTRAPDNQVIAKAQELDSILLSLNGDFADIVAYPPRDYRGIVALQLHDRPETLPSLLAGLREFFAEHDDPEYFRGKLFVVEVHRIRIRS